MKKILLTGARGMLAYDFIRSQKEKFDVVAVDRSECDITSFASILQCIAMHEPDIVLNCAAYTAVDDAEDIGMQANYEVNTLGTFFLAKATSAFGIPLVSISTDYVFDGKNPDGYHPYDLCHPINAYGMAKYLGERLALETNHQTRIIRTSWLYGGEIYDGNPLKPGIYKNFVNTMLRLAEKSDTVQVVDDQHGRPTSCLDLSAFIADQIENMNHEEDGGRIFHYSSPLDVFSLTWADFAERIFAQYNKNVNVVRIASSEFPTRARRPEWSILL